MSRLIPALFSAVLATSAYGADMHVDFSNHQKNSPDEISTANRLLDEWLDTLDIDLKKSENPENIKDNPRFAILNYVSPEQFANRLLIDYNVLGSEEYRGFANPETRNAYIKVEFEDSYCQANRALLLFSVARHELLHLLGLYHHDIALYIYQDSQNKVIMAHNLLFPGASDGNIQLTQNKLCNKALSELSYQDIPTHITDEQVRQIKDSLQGGKFWQNFVNNNYDFLKHKETISGTPLSSTD